MYELYGRDLTSHPQTSGRTFHKVINDSEHEAASEWFLFIIILLLVCECVLVSVAFTKLISTEERIAVS